MNTRRNIQRLIQKSEEELFKLHDAIQMKRAYIQGLRDSLKYLPKDDADDAATTLRVGSDLAKAQEAILKAGKPLHITELLKALGKEATHKNRVSLSGSIGAYVRKKQFFTRPAPNTFGVTEEIDAPKSSNGEPPENFGVEEEEEIPF